MRRSLTAVVLAGAALFTFSTPANASYFDGDGCDLRGQSIYSTDLQVIGVATTSCTPTVIWAESWAYMEYQPHWYSGFQRISSQAYQSKPNKYFDYFSVKPAPVGDERSGCHDYRMTIYNHADSAKSGWHYSGRIEGKQFHICKG